MAKNQMTSKLKNTLSLSIQKAWEKTPPIATNMTDFEGNNEPGENDDDEIKETRHKMKFVNVAAVVICTGLLINRASICVQR